MKNSDKILYKERILKSVEAIIRQRMEVCSSAILNAQINANAEQKSSAGDKYETSRAMSQLDKEMYSRQMDAIQSELNSLLTIKSLICSTIKGGAVIKCNGYTFFIAAGVGKLFLDGEDILIISPGAPLAQKLYGLNRGDNFVFNNINLIISDYF